MLLEWFELVSLLLSKEKYLKEEKTLYNAIINEHQSFLESLLMLQFHESKSVQKELERLIHS